MKNRKHVNLKDIKSEYGLSYYYLFNSISIVYMYVCKLKNMNVCNEIVFMVQSVNCYMSLIGYLLCMFENMFL